MVPKYVTLNRVIKVFVTVLGSGSAATANVSEVSKPRVESWTKITFCCSYASGGTCGGDSGGAFLTSIEILDAVQTKTVQLGVLHGGLKSCSNVKFPAIYTRLDHPEIHAWLLNQITANGKSLL